jgi:hypothetical protein
MEFNSVEAAWQYAAEFKLGLYEHYKGGRYSAIALVTHHETRAPMVLYVSHTYGGVNVRPLVGWTGDADGFVDTVSVRLEGLGNQQLQRFKYIGPLPSDTPLKDR